MAEVCQLFQAKFGVPVTENQLAIEGNLMGFGVKKVKATGLTWEGAPQLTDLEFEIRVDPKK